MLKAISTVIDIALARAALKKHRQGEKLLAFFNGAEQARRRALADIPLAVKVFVVALPRGGEVRIDGEFVAFDADFAVDQRATAGMIGQAQGNFRFV